MAKTTLEQRAELLSYGNYLAGCSGDGELIIKALDDLAEAELRAAQWEAIFRRDWNLGECQPGVYEVWRLWKNPGDTISTGPTEQAAIDAAFERYPLGESKSGA